MVVGMAAPGVAKVMAHLRYPHRTAHGPEMGVCQDDVHRLGLQGMAHFTPVRSDHVGGCGEAGAASELAHNLAAGVHALSSAGILAVCKNALHSLYILNGLLEQPAAVGIQVNPGIRECLLELTDYMHLLVSCENAAFELEILEAVFLMNRFCMGNNLVRGQSLLMTQPVPLAVGVRLGVIGQIGLISVAHEEQIAQHAYLVSLLAVSQELTYRHIQVFSQQIQAGSFDGCQNMHAGAQVKGLVAADIHLALGIQIALYL